MGSIMEQYIIKGGTPLSGEVMIGGAKNAALGIIAAAVMSDEQVTIENIIDAVADKVKNRDLYKRSFAIYALHINASAIITHLIYIVLPKNEYMAVPNFLLTIVLTVLSINIFCIVTEKLFPKIYGIVMGQR